MPYYGDPASIRLMCQNVRSLKNMDSAEYDAYIATIDAIVTPLMVAELQAVFSALPAPTGTNGTVLATLWLLGMVAEVTDQKFSTNRVGGEPQRAIRKQDAFDSLMASIKSGRTVIEGATRVGHRLGATPGQASRIIGQNPDNVTDPVAVDDQFAKLKNLRF
jgi:hypothetical protein